MLKHLTTPHEVLNPLTNDWLLISPQRTSRPWQGQLENNLEEPRLEYDKSCYLCPSNLRNTSERNPSYDSTFVFVNDYSALLPEVDEAIESPSKLFTSRTESGTCEVICYSPKHNLVMANMSQAELKLVVNLWKDRYVELSGRDNISHVQIFENRGSEIGASNPHPHGQIWAQSHIPVLPAKEIASQEKYYQKQGTPLLIDYVQSELATNERVVYQNDEFVIVVPYWAFWPYETMILPKAHISSLADLQLSQVDSLADVLSITTKTYAKFFGRPIYGAPYLLGIHQAPTDGRDTSALQLHIHFETPLLTPKLQKHVGGYERFGQLQRDITASTAAQNLRQALAMISLKR